MVHGKSEQELKGTTIDYYETLARGDQSDRRDQELMNKVLNLENEWLVHSGAYFAPALRAEILLKKQNLIQSGVWSGGTGTPFEIGHDLGDLETEGTPEFLEFIYENTSLTAVQERIYQHPYFQSIRNREDKLENFVRPLKIQSAYAETETPTISTKSSISFVPVALVGIAIIAIVFLILRRRA